MWAIVPLVIGYITRQVLPDFSHCIFFIDRESYPDWHLMCSIFFKHAHIPYMSCSNNACDFFVYINAWALYYIFL